MSQLDRTLQGALTALSWLMAPDNLHTSRNAMIVATHFHYLDDAAGRSVLPVMFQCFSVFFVRMMRMEKQ